MKKPDSIDQMWELFVVRVKLQGASLIQLSEMEMAFKAGCSAMLMEMKGPVTELPDEAALRTLDRWQTEMNEFFLRRMREYRERDVRQ